MKISGTEYEKVMRLVQDHLDTADSPTPSADATESAVDPEEAKLIEEMVRRVEELPDVREDVVEDIRARIADGTYKINSAAVAELMLRRCRADRLK